jgi:hypothetical protein
VEGVRRQLVERYRRSHHRVRPIVHMPTSLTMRFVRLFLVYLPLRLYGVTKDHLGASDFALSMLACESSLLFPRYLAHPFRCEIGSESLILRIDWRSSSCSGTFWSCA